MGVGILIGMVIDVVLAGMGFLAWRVWRDHLPTAPPQPPRTPAQQANAEAFDELERNTPRVVSMQVQRRTTRGNRRRVMERDHDTFDS